MDLNSNSIQQLRDNIAEVSQGSSVDVPPIKEKKKAKTSEERIINYRAAITKKKREIDKLNEEIKMLQKRIEEIEAAQLNKELDYLKEYMVKNNISPKALLQDLIEKSKENGTV